MGSKYSNTYKKLWKNYLNIGVLKLKASSSFFQATIGKIDRFLRINIENWDRWDQSIRILIRNYERII